MNFTIDFPPDLGEILKNHPDANEFVVQATQIALEEKTIAKRLAKAATQSEQGEDATEKVDAFFAKWSQYES
ncbi:hypothetical protein ACQZV8_05820 [Magnetococcales bacterium HHB-1]